MVRLGERQNEDADAGRRIQSLNGKRRATAETEGGMNVNIEQENLKQGVLGLVLALVEIIRDLLKTQAVRRLEAGSLNDAEIERLGKSLMEFDRIVEQLKEENGVVEAVRSVRESLDNLVEGVLRGGVHGR